GLNEGDTRLMLKQLSPVRLVRNNFFRQVEEAELHGASVEELRALLGRGRSKKGLFEGKLDDGELEIGQVVAMINDKESVSEVMLDVISGYNAGRKRISELPELSL
ncbi:MAG: nitronate monooxygenase, partial [Bacteroidales bacterium]